MKKIISIIAFLFFASTIISAQITKEKAIKVKQERKLADLMYAQSHYYTAIEYYKEVIRERPEERYSVYWLGMSYLMARDYESAATWLGNFHDMAPDNKKQKRIEKENKEIYGLSRFHYGTALKQSGEYEEAVTQFEAFNGKYIGEDEKSTTIWKLKAKNEIAGANLAIEMADSAPKVRVETLGENVNSAYEEASPVIVNDSTMYYTSLNEDDLIFIDNKKDIPLYKMYQSVKTDGEWGKGKMLPSNLQDEKYSTGNAAISEDGNRMYFCKCWHNEVDEIICNLYFSKKAESGRWLEPEKLNDQINSSKYTSTQPAVRTTGDDMDIVYFVSDREGGVGGMDIWYFIRTKSGGYKGPRVVKGNINTIRDEMTPFYDNSTEMLYFSSNGHPSFGGYDVFSSYDTEDLGWDKPQNLGFPINSPADDLYYTKAFDGTDGFLVSNRDGAEQIRNRYTGDDLYAFSDFKYGLEGFALLQEKDGESPLEDAIVSLYEIDTAGNTILVQELENISDKYFFDLSPDKD
ncbi:MAG: tetratricopeptide repeat protein, partial [Chitinophagales bacterium]